SEVRGQPVAVPQAVSGLLVPSHGAEEWADALAAVALRPDRRAELAANAVRHAQRFSWRRTTDSLLDIYAQATRAFRQALELRAEVAV
ncbi:D-inositol-3-phosphate glycosyltransferase, partial [Amycolatopsis sp. NPDC000673]